MVRDAASLPDWPAAATAVSTWQPFTSVTHLIAVERQTNRLCAYYEPISEDIDVSIALAMSTN